MIKKTIHYTQSDELKLLAEQLRSKYFEIIDYIDVDKIFFAFKGGDVPDWFTYEILGLKSEWIKFTQSGDDPKIYCISMTYDFYQQMQGSRLEWIMLESLYACSPKMNGKTRGRSIREFPIILDTLTDLGFSYNWRDDSEIPSLLGEETIVFIDEQEEDEEDDF